MPIWLISNQNQRMKNYFDIIQFHLLVYSGPSLNMVADFFKAFKEVLQIVRICFFSLFNRLETVFGYFTI